MHMKTLISTLCIMAVSLFAVASASAADDNKEEAAAGKTYAVGVTGVT